MSMVNGKNIGMVSGKRVLPFLLVVLVLFSTACEGRNETYDILYEYNRQNVYFPEKRWSKPLSPELAGWSTVKLEQARQYAESIHSDAVVVVENGVVIAEWGNITTRYNIHSIRKSIMSAMYGIYVEQKIINPASTLEDLHITDIGGLTSKEKSATVRNLLAARSGVYHPAAYETEAMEKKRPPRGSHDPGTFWYYNNWDFNVLLTIFNQQTKQDFFEQFQERIALPLQMEQFRLEDTSYYFDLKTSSHPAYLFRMSALDLARFGLLYLRKGKWKDKQIIPSIWIEESTRLHTIFNPAKSPHRGYGYMWYIDEEVFYAQGTGGQRIFIVPGYSLVVVHRVNTDIGKGIGNRKIWKLLDLIIQGSPQHLEKQP